MNYYTNDTKAEELAILAELADLLTQPDSDKKRLALFMLQYEMKPILDDTSPSKRARPARLRRALRALADYYSTSFKYLYLEGADDEQ